MRLLLRLSVLLTVAFAVIIGVIRAQPEAHPELERLLVPPPGCAMPCFLGIQPGQTSAEQATDILEAHPYVGEVRGVGAGDRRLSSIRWRWADDAPPGVASFRDNVLEVERGVVMGIQFNLFFSTGATWRVLTTNRADGDLLAAYVRLDSPNCLYPPLLHYRGTPERLFFSMRPANPNPPWRPKATRDTRNCPP